MPISTQQRNELQQRAASLMDAATRLAQMVAALHADAAPPAPTPAPPAPTPAPPAPTPPAPAPSGPALYFSPDGDDANPGTASLPKRNLSSVNPNALTPGTRLRFVRGAVHTVAYSRLMNPAATPENRIVFEDYGSAAEQPVLQFGAGPVGFEFGRNFGDTTSHGGYAFRNLHLRGNAVDGSWGFWSKKNVADVLVEGCTVSNWSIGFNAQGGDNSRRIVLRNNRIRDNFAMGVLGCFFESLFEGNDFSGAILPRSHFDHLLYLRGGDQNVVRGNRLLTDTPARGGTFTFHGYVPTSLVVEDNDLRYGPGGDEGAWIISLIPDNGTENGGWRNLVVRRNTVQNGGNNGIHIEASPGALVEGNTSILTVPRFQTAIGWVDDPGRPNDLKGGGTMRGNRARGPAGSQFSFVAPAGTVSEDNTAAVQ